jgi:O-acetyl-ADP-ribose deacetylase (regulator of RNase III)
MVRCLAGDITALKDVEVIVNAANGVGPMGRGVAGAIGYAGGLELRNDVRRVCEARKQGTHPGYGYEPGECYISKPGDLEDNGIKAVYHAVTMKYPGSPTSTAIVEQAMRKTLEVAVANNIKSIAFPGLGTGVGALDKQQVASKMASIAECFCGKIDITIIDLDKDFIGYVRDRIGTEEP